MQPSPFLDVIVRSYLNVHRRFRCQSPPLERRVNGTCANFDSDMAGQKQWPEEHCATEPFGFLDRMGHAIVILCLVAGVMRASAGVLEVGPIELTVNDLDRELQFFTNALPFRVVADSESSRGAMDGLLGLQNTELRTAELELGDERIRLTEHLTQKGRPIPQDSRSFDLWFQHIAIVVSDMDKAYAHLRSHKVKHVSTAPQTLPAWNKDAGGIKAFYFRDPEDHVLEIIWFPAGKGYPKWQKPTTNVFLGIDHTAIVVNDTDFSLRFYTNVLGLRVVGSAENHGTEQEHLNQVFGARLRITALRAESGSGIELLEYIAPPGGRRLAPESRANDLVFWRTHLLVNGYDYLSDGKGGMQARPVSTSGVLGSFIIRDPDGHALELDDIRAVRSPVAAGVPLR